MKVHSKKRSWTIEQLKEAVKNSYSYRQVLAKLGLREAGGNYDQLKKYIKEYTINTSHFKGMAWNKGLRGIGKYRMPLKEILTKNNHFQSFKLKNRLFKSGLKPLKCEKCGWAKTTPEGHLPLELHHINGNRHDNRLQNLLILCPNCHSLEPNYRGRGGRQKALPVFELETIA